MTLADYVVTGKFDDLRDADGAKSTENSKHLKSLGFSLRVPGKANKVYTIETPLSDDADADADTDDDDTSCDEINLSDDDDDSDDSDAVAAKYKETAVLKWDGDKMTFEIVRTERGKTTTWLVGLDSDYECGDPEGKIGRVSSRMTDLDEDSNAGLLYGAFSWWEWQLSERCGGFCTHRSHAKSNHADDFRDWARGRTEE